LPEIHNPYERFINAFVHWLNPKRIGVYTVSLPLATLAVVLGMTFIKGPHWLFYRGDFILYYTGGTFFLTGRLDELYDFAEQARFQKDTVGLESDQITPFNHPPFAALLYAPFALPGFEPGLLAWLGVGLVALTFAWRLLRRELLPLAAFSTASLTLLSLRFYPTIGWLLADQNSAWSFLLYTATYVGLRRGNDFTAGAALGLLVYKPQLVLGPAFLLLIKKRWRALAGCFLTAAILVGLGFLASPSAMREYVRILPEVARFPFLTGYPIWQMHNLYGFCLLLLGDILPATFLEQLTVVLTLAGFLTLFSWWRKTAWHPGARAWDLNVACSLALGLLISPHLMLYDLMILLLPLAIVWAHYPKSVNERAMDGGPLLAWTALLYAAVFFSSYLGWSTLRFTPSLGLPKFAVQVSVLVLLGWIVAVRRAAIAAHRAPAP
jgi:Glycosyltransferase family 87